MTEEFCKKHKTHLRKARNRGKYCKFCESEKNEAKNRKHDIGRK